MQLKLKEIAKKRLELGAGYVLRTLERLEEEVREFETYAAGSSLPSEVLADDYAVMAGYHAELCDSLIVWLYHWSERELKVLLAEETKLPLAETAKLSNASALKKEWGKAGLDLSTCAHAATIHLARVFANSWKHNPLEPSEPLLQAIGIDPGAHRGLGLLTDSTVREALSKEVVGKTVPEAEIVAAMAECVRDHLLDVLSHCSF